VVYPAASDGTYPEGVAWNGVTGWTESPSGADETALYADNIKYLSLRSAEEFGATLTAYTYPDEFAVLDGSASIEGLSGVRIYQQARKSFGLAIRTLIGNDIDSNDHGYLLHLVYGLTASPSERGYSTVNDSPEAIEFSWEMKSVPVNVTGYKPTSIVTIDSTKVSAAKLADLEDIIYGTSAGDRYFVTDDTTVDSSKTYYELVNGTYTEVSNPEGNPHTQGYYEKKTLTDTTARLPLPDEVIAILKGTANVGG
jgi:hypothetical protein